eukprot:435395-Pleurochrysis_carterae.AAC.1
MQRSSHGEALQVRPCLRERDRPPPPPLSNLALPPSSAPPPRLAPHREADGPLEERHGVGLARPLAVGAKRRVQQLRVGGIRRACTSTRGHTHRRRQKTQAHA